LNPARPSGFCSPQATAHAFPLLVDSTFSHAVSATAVSHTDRSATAPETRISKWWRFELFIDTTPPLPFEPEQVPLLQFVLPAAIESVSHTVERIYVEPPKSGFLLPLSSLTPPWMFG